MTRPLALATRVDFRHEPSLQQPPAGYRTFRIWEFSAVWPFPICQYFVAFETASHLAPTILIECNGTLMSTRLSIHEGALDRVLTMALLNVSSAPED